MKPSDNGIDITLMSALVLFWILETENGDGPGPGPERDNIPPYSLLEKVSCSFRQMSYQIYMHLHRVFFGITNLRKHGKYSIVSKIVFVSFIVVFFTIVGFFLFFWLS